MNPLAQALGRLGKGKKKKLTRTQRDAQRQRMVALNAARRSSAVPGEHTEKA